MMGEKEENKCTIPDDMKIAAEIYEYNEIKEEDIYFSKLVKSLKDYMTEETIGKELNKLFDDGIVRGKYKEFEDGREGRVLYIDNIVKDTIKSVYDIFWKDEKGDN